MSTTTVNTFPPIHAFDSPRSWFLAFIVLLHIGFFWALNNGFSLSRIILPPPQTRVVLVPEEPKPTPREIPVLQTNRLPWTQTAVPVPQPPDPQYQSEDRIETVPTQPLPPIGGTSRVPEPVIVQPAIPRTGLSEPVYPASAIRAGQTGTVLLSVQVLENGRVGEVRLLQSSGFAKLDDSALREARKWRFVPGTRDGVPVALWKQVPIKFELSENHR